MLIVHIVNNKVINMLEAASIENFKQFNNEQTRFEEYNKDIHPWGINKILDIEVGLGWKDRLKEKLGYCIFCGDGLQIPEKTGSL